MEKSHYKHLDEILIYVKKINDDIDELERINQRHRFAVRNEKLTSLGAILAAIGTLGILFFEILKLIYHHWKQICSFF
jgi:hypothetical protein